MNSYEKIYTLLGERTNPSTKAKAAAKAGRMAKKARSLMRKGGKVRGIDVSKEAMAHMSGRGEGSQSDEAPGVTAVRQLKIAAPKHKRGEVAVTSSHGAKTTGTELVKKRSEIPDKDVVKTSTTTKPERGEDVEVSKVHTSKPVSHYKSKAATSIVRPKDPAFMSPKGKREKSRAYKKRTTGHTTLTTHPGRSAPPVSQWKQSGHVVVEPRKDEMNSYERIYNILTETVNPQLRAKSKVSSKARRMKKPRIERESEESRRSAVSPKLSGTWGSGDAEFHGHDQALVRRMTRKHGSLEAAQDHASTPEGRREVQASQMKFQRNDPRRRGKIHPKF